MSYIETLGRADFEKMKLKESPYKPKDFHNYVDKRTKCVGSV